MSGTESESGSDARRKFLGKHWGIVVVFVIAGILAFVGAVYVFLWFVGSALSTGLVPVALGLWTMGNVVTFILYLVFWELLFIGVPAVVGGVAGWLWWRRLPSKEKREYHLSGKRSRARRGGSGIPLLLFIAFCIKVFIDGNWNVAIATWTLNYVVDSIITILVWTAIVFGIPIVIGLVWWIHREVKKP
ncbi:MAG: hypothetical protein WED05_03250 [Candidatus Atabeyarchaeum deiterrae]